MERIKLAYRNMPLKRTLTVTVVGSLITSFLLSIFVLLITRPSYYRLTATNPESMAGKIHDGITFLVVCLCIIIPIVIGISFFYKNKLSKPLSVLMDGTKQIALDNLDFTIHYDEMDEFGELCNSFDKMREALQSNYKQMWRMTEKRKELNAAFAHDLRTPLTVLRGYTDFLEEYIPSSDRNDEKLISTNHMMALYIKRLEDYVETMNTIQKIEDTPIKIASVATTDFIEILTDSVQSTAEEYGKQFTVENQIDLANIKGDVPLIFRAIENVVRNAFQYAKSEVRIKLFLENHKLTIEVIDDGMGFSSEGLQQALSPFYTSAKLDTMHYGMGLAICKTLCENHGGTISIANTDNLGAKVQISFLLEK
jgi:two-component system, OmpR family, lantibiotic biosynthesis sensor histidine kinase NisK/SpaK